MISPPKKSITVFLPDGTKKVLEGRAKSTRPRTASGLR